MLATISVARSVGPVRVLPSRATMTPEQIARACEGDEELLAALVGEVLPAIRLEVTFGLRRKARVLGRDAAQDVDDFIQDVLVHLLSDGGSKLRAWDPARGRSLSSFVRLLARHRVLRVLEGLRGNPWEGGAADEPDLVEQQSTVRSEAFEQLLSRQQLEGLMKRLRARFDERSDLLFELIYVEQQPVIEVCETMGMTRAAVDQWNVRLRRLVRQLAHELDRAPVGEPRAEGSRVRGMGR